jgi:aryl-alcohol dehydrogenase-like predicted oxidoreductase
MNIVGNLKHLIGKKVLRRLEWKGCEMKRRKLGIRDLKFYRWHWADLKALDEVAAQYNSTLARVALAWLIARPSINAPIRQCHKSTIERFDRGDKTAT